jgi:hypothetical protein
MISVTDDVSPGANSYMQHTVGICPTDRIQFVQTAREWSHVSRDERNFDNFAIP